MLLKTIQRHSIPSLNDLNLLTKTSQVPLLTRCLRSEPSQATSCPDVKQMYINELFCCADKFAILINWLGIVRHIAFLDDYDFKTSHLELVVEKKIDSPDEDKSVGDTSSLVPVLDNFFPCILIFSLMFFLEIPLLILLNSMESCSVTFIFSGFLFPIPPETKAIVERAINHFKINMCIAGRKTINHTATKADVFLPVLPAN